MKKNVLIGADTTLLFFNHRAVIQDYINHLRFKERLIFIAGNESSYTADVYGVFVKCPELLLSTTSRSVSSLLANTTSHECVQLAILLIDCDGGETIQTLQVTGTSIAIINVRQMHIDNALKTCSAILEDGIHCRCNIYSMIPIITEELSESSEMEIVNRGTFLTTKYLSGKELSLGISYLESVAQKSLLANQQLIIAYTEKCQNSYDYAKQICDAVYRLISLSPAATGIRYVHYLKEYNALREEIIYLLSLMAAKNSPSQEGYDSAVSALIEIEKLNLNACDNIGHMLEACRASLDHPHVLKAYYEFFDPDEPRLSFDEITYDDAICYINRYSKDNSFKKIESFLCRIQKSSSVDMQKIIDGYTCQLEKKTAQKNKHEINNTRVLAFLEQNLDGKKNK